jgi:hypothetical protein
MTLASIFASGFVSGLAVLLAGGVARADAPAAPPAGAAFSGDTLQLALRDRIAVNYPGATAVFSIDAGVAEASVSGGRIAIVARAVGSTTISVVTATGVTSFLVTVVPPAPWLAPAGGPASRSWTVWQSNFQSMPELLTNSLELVDGNEHRTARGYVVNVLRLDNPDSGDTDARTSLPALAVEWRTRRYELVAFDKLIEHSQLTLDGVTVRGGHLRFDGLELHAGVTSPLLYQNVFLSTEREVVLGASYELRAGRSSVTPSVYSYPSEPATGGTKGTMGSLLYRYAAADDRLRLRAEAGWGGVLGAAGELTYHDDVQRGWLSVRHEPRGFAALGIGHPIGSTADGMWSAEPTRQWMLSATGSAARYEVTAQHQDVEAGSAEVRYRIEPPLAVSVGGAVGRFAGDALPTVTSLTVPVGIYLDGPEFGGSAIYRWQTNTARNRGGHGGRVNLHTHHGALHASGFVDVQQDAATLELILRSEPLLAHQLNELGLTATSPEDLALLLRENAALSQLGYVQGANLEFSPWRVQTGADVAWIAQDETRQQLRLRGLLDRTQAVNGRQDTRSVSLSYARRLSRAIDMTAMLSWWSHDAVMQSSTDSWAVSAGVRVRIDDVPHLAVWKRGDITGTVVDDAEHSAPVAGVKVRLDGGRAVVSDAAGRFEFEDVASGDHRVDAEAPDDMYFTGPSRVAVAAGGAVQFGMARAAAYLSGYVRDDRGAGVGGVSIVLRGGALGDHTATTDSSGRFRFAVARGEYVIDPVLESVPAGYDLAAVLPRSVQVAAASPAQVDLVVPANRSIAGTIRDPRIASGTASIRILELDRAAAIDNDGRYVFRGLPPGTYTIEVVVAGTAMRHTVEVPAEPSAIRDIDFP